MLDRDNDGFIDVPPDWEKYTSGDGCGCLLIIIIAGVLIFMMMN